MTSIIPGNEVNYSLEFILEVKFGDDSEKVKPQSLDKLTMLTLNNLSIFNSGGLQLSLIISARGQKSKYSTQGWNGEEQIYGLLFWNQACAFIGLGKPALSLQ